MAVFRREAPPTQQRGASLTSWLARLVSNIEAFAKNISATVDTLRQMRQLTGVTINWQWSDLTDTTVDPGAGMMRGNQINLNVVTQLAVSNTDLFGRLVDGSELKGVLAGDFFVVAELTRLTWFYYTLDTAITPMDGGAWFQLNLTGVAGASGNPADMDFMENQWLPRII